MKGRYVMDEEYFMSEEYFIDECITAKWNIYSTYKDKEVKDNEREYLYEIEHD